LRKIKEAIPMREEHDYNLQQLESVIDMRTLKRWKVEVEAWESDSTKPNPFEPRGKGKHPR
jgi:hypothetical protein